MQYLAQSEAKMSIKIMSLVWDKGPDEKAELLVLLVLADFCNDDGECWPSMATIGKKSRMSERNARRIMRMLEEKGYVQTMSGGGRHGCSKYRINQDKMPPGQNVPPGQIEHKTRTKPAQNPDIAMSAEPSITIKEPSSSKRDAQEVRSIIEAWASPDAVSSFMAYRGKQRGKALTVTAAKRLAENLKAIFNEGGDTDDALGMAEERSWLTIQPDWYFKAKGNGNGNGSQHRKSPADDPALRAIAIAARGF